MGETLRRYWIPALMSSELPEPDCPPVRVQLLEEQLVAFRDTLGRIGILDASCPHRGASLFLGRNEECGLRCVFHGWKFDVDGNCLDMMNEAPDYSYKDEVHVIAYPTVEMGGVIWAYMGPKDRTPALPKFEWTQVPATHRHVSKIRQECNWLQALEGGIDTAHAPILHRTLTPDTKKAGIGITTDFVQGGAPTLEVEITDYGYRYVGVRPLGERGKYVRSYHYVMPFHAMRPRQAGYKGQPDRPNVAGHMWVPMDDQHVMIYNWVYSFGDQPITDEEWMAMERGYGRGSGEILPDFRSIRNRANDWLIDRRVQKTETFSGIEGINNQDIAVQESMGPVVDRTREHLTLSDRAVVAARRLLLQATRTVADGGDPPGTGAGYYRARAIEGVIPDGVKWQDALLPKMYAGRG
jgi:phenylpropionate dioxygenase-like ring-hydroxylating dioxygenase large terminal subunit